MLDRLGRVLRVGELVSITNHKELTIKVNWEIIAYIDHGIAVEAILRNFISREIAFINVLDLEKEFY